MPRSKDIGEQTQRIERGVKESDIQRACTDLLTAEHILWFRMNVLKQYIPYQTKDGKKHVRRLSAGTLGMADIVSFVSLCGLQTCGIHHCILWLEIKGPRGTQTTDQKAFQELVESHGHTYLVVKSVDELQGWLKA